MSIIISENELNRRSIRVQTRKGNDIFNSQSFIISDHEKSQFPDIRKKFTSVNFRSLPSAIYNCHGLVFASRRTGIDDTEEIYKILKDDNYTEILLADVLPGDIIIYFSSNGDAEHSGVVISKPDPQLHIPQVYSKWGNYCEAIHYANYCPYDYSNVKFYRVRE